MAKIKKFKCWKREKGRGNQINFIRTKREKGVSGVIAIQEIPQFEGDPIYIFVTSKSGTRKKFKKQSQAIKFAHRYMKKHNVC